MKTSMIVFGLLLAWIGCDNHDDIQRADLREVNAVWTNQLAADGCSWHFSVMSADSSSSVSYVPSDASLATIEKFIGKNDSYYSFTDVRLKYSLTGRNKEVQCGWGKKASFAEIDVIEINKK